MAGETEGKGVKLSRYGYGIMFLGEEKGEERLGLSISGRRTHLNTPSFGNGSTPLLSKFVFHLCTIFSDTVVNPRISITCRK